MISRIMNRRSPVAWVLLIGFAGVSAWNLSVVVAWRETPAVIEVAPFSAATVGHTVPEGWTPLAFKKIPRQTHYEVVKDGDVTVVKAESDASASGLT